MDQEQWDHSFLLTLLDPIISPSTLVILPCTLLSLFHSHPHLIPLPILCPFYVFRNAQQLRPRVVKDDEWMSTWCGVLPHDDLSHSSSSCKKGQVMGVWDREWSPMIFSSSISMCNTSLLCPLYIPPSLSFPRRGSTWSPLLSLLLQLLLLPIQTAPITQPHFDTHHQHAVSSRWTSPLHSMRYGRETVVHG